VAVVVVAMAGIQNLMPTLREQTVVLVADRVKQKM